MALEVLWSIKQPNDPEDMAKLYAHALIKRVEAECKVVGYHHVSIPNETSFDHLDFDSYDDEYGRKHWVSTPLTALPLVSEE